MSISYSGRDRKVEAEVVRIEILKDNPLLALANAIPWPTMMDLVAEDLKATIAGGMWWVDRKLLLRVHLAIFIFQKIFDLSDRSVRECLQTDAAFQIFLEVKLSRSGRFLLSKSSRNFGIDCQSRLMWL